MDSKEKFQREKFIQFKKRDRSSKGEMDKKIEKLIKKINRKNDYYTTSSCSGRIVLIKGKEKKQEGLYIFKTHGKISLKELKKALKDAIEKYHGLIYFKQECCILHAACSSIEKAQELVNKAKLAGWKNSGIISAGNKKSRAMCELKSTEYMSMPIAMKKILVSDAFLKLLASESNKKLARTWEKIKKLEKII